MPATITPISLLGFMGERVGRSSSSASMVLTFRTPFRRSYELCFGFN